MHCRKTGYDNSSVIARFVLEVIEEYMRQIITEKQQEINQDSKSAFKDSNIQKMN